MSINASSGVLHTKSSYFSETAASYSAGGMAHTNLFSSEAIQADLVDALHYAMTKELEFYHQYFPDVGGYRDFIAKVRELFEKAGDDAKLLLGLSNVNLKKFVPKDLTDIGTELDAKILFTTRPGFIDMSKLNVSNYGIQVRTDPNYFYIDLTEDNVKEFIQDLKKITDEAFKKETKFKGQVIDKGGPFGGQKRGTTKIQSNMKRYDTTIAWLERQSKDILKKMGLTVHVTEKEASISETDEIKTKVKPFAKYKKSDIPLPGEDPAFDAEFEKYYNSIKDFMLTPLLKGSEILQEAATKAWTSLAGDVHQAIRDYFFEGDNLYKSILGNGGEFQLQIIHNYLALSSEKYGGALGNVIGGIGTGKRQEPRSDFQIMSMLDADIGNFVAGIQVKNVSESTATKIHISTDLELMAPGMPEGLRDTLANSMFNSDIKAHVPDIEATLKSYVEAYFWRAMNLHVGEGLNPNHTNTFYMYRGTSLIPASKIILDMINSTTKTKPPDFTLDGLTAPIGSDASFAERQGPDNKPNFLEYWDTVQYLGFGQGAVLDENTLNTSLYNSLLAGVSIRSTFNLNAVASNLSDIGSIELFPRK